MKKMLFVLAFALVTLPGLAHKYDRDAIRASVDRQLQTCPESTLKDLYKNFFQDAFGPGHLVGTGADARKAVADAIINECATAAQEEIRIPEYSLTGWRGNFYRVNLSVINDGKVPLDTFVDAFMDSAVSFSLPEIREWRKEWRVILSEIRRAGGRRIPGFRSDRRAIARMLAGGDYASHHSAAYNAAYHPHYRLIERSVFESRLLPLLNR